MASSDYHLILAEQILSKQDQLDKVWELCTRTKNEEDARLLQQVFYTLRNGQTLAERVLALD